MAFFGKDKKIDTILTGKKVAILATDGYEESELLTPKKALDDAGAETFIVSLKEGKIKGWKHGDWSGSIDVDLIAADADADDYDALVLPGGVMNPDKLRTDMKAVEFVSHFVEA